MMAEHFWRRNGHTIPQSKPGGLCNNDSPEQLDTCSYNFHALGDQRSETLSTPQNYGPFLQNFPHSLDGTGDEDLVPATDRSYEICAPADVPSSLSSTFIASTVSSTYDTRDFDTPGPSVVVPSSVMLNSDDCAMEYGPNCWNPLRHSTSHMLPGSSSNSILVNNGHPNARTESYNPTITQKRKWSVEENNDLIDRKSALKLFVKHLTDPAISTVKCLARDFGVSVNFIMDLCEQNTGHHESGSLPLDNSARANHSMSTYRESEIFIVPTGDNSAPGVEVDPWTPTEIPNKRLRLNVKASEASGGNPQNKPHQCPKCHRGFVRQADLARHLRTHVPGQFHCQYPGCNMVFSRKDKWKDHWRRKHAEATFKFDMAQRRQEDPENDPDSGSTRGGGFLQGDKPLQGAEKGAGSSASGFSACNTSSGAVMGKHTANLEVYYPVLFCKTVIEFLRKFARAQVIRKLGQGGFGHVYELSITTGTNGKDHETFACKMIRLPGHGGHEVIERARNEISILQVLDHPHIITFAGAFISADRILINTRPVAECNLKEFLSQQPSPLSTVAKCQLWEGVRGLASALAYLHGHGRGEGFHGDVKPENILVIQDTEVKSCTRLLLADFGSARLSTSKSQIGHRNQAATPRYCAPEWFQNNNDRGPPSDIWSFGCILTQIVTYLHDRTMGDFDVFRGGHMESKKDWNYHESHPVVHDWLRFLSRNWSNLAYPAVRHEHMKLISDMLSLIPRDRPSAIDVVAKLDVYNNLAAQKADQARNTITELIKQPQQILQHAPTKVYRTSNCASRHAGMEHLRKWLDEINGLDCIIGQSGGGESTPMHYTPNDPAEALRWKHVLSGTVGLNTSQMHHSIRDVGNSINPSLNYIVTTQCIREGYSPYDRIITHSIQVESFISSKVDIVIKLADSQVSRIGLACLQPRRPYYQLKLIPKRQPQVETLDEYSCPRGIRPRGNSNPQNLEQRQSHSLSGRRGPLPSAKLMIGLKACRNCLIKTELWRHSTPCDRCRDSLPSPFKTMICFRAPLGQCASIFFPELVYSRLSESAIKELIRKNVTGFTENKIKVEMSSGPCYQPIVLTVHEFVPSNPEFLSLSYVEKDCVGELQKFTPSYAPPLGLHGIGINDLRNKCLSHIESIIEKGRDLGELISGDTSIISWKVLEAITCYHKLSGGFTANVLLRKTVMLYAMHYFMSRLIILTRESAEEAVASLRAPKMLLYKPVVASKLLNLQLKQAMDTVMRDMTRDILEGLDWELRHPRKQSSWAVTFCVVLVLCMCTELIQVAIDSFTVAVGHNTPTFRQSAIEIMRGLEEHTYEHIVILFHGAHRTARSSFSRTRSLRVNPIQDGLTVDEKSGITQSEANLVHDIRQIMKECEGEIEEKAGNPSFEAGPDLLARHMAFRKRNSGRLVSKFLKSFT